MKHVRSIMIVSVIGLLSVTSIYNHAAVDASNLLGILGNIQKEKADDWSDGISPDSIAVYTVSIPSDTATEYFSNFVFYPSVEAWKHPSWPSISGARWIWKSYLVTPDEALNGTSVITFMRTFDLPEQLESATGTLHITADNAYEVSLNSIIVGHDGVLDVNSCDAGYTSVESYSVLPVPGKNTLTIRAINYKDCNGNNVPRSNPAGVLFRLDMEYTLIESTLYIPLTIR